MSYTDLVCVGDRLIAKSRDDYSGEMTIVTGFLVVSRTHAKRHIDGKMFRLNRRGNNAALFVGNGKVLGRV